MDILSELQEYEVWMHLEHLDAFGHVWRCLDALGRVWTGFGQVQIGFGRVWKGFGGVWRSLEEFEEVFKQISYPCPPELQEYEVAKSMDFGHLIKLGKYSRNCKFHAINSKIDL